MNHETVAVCPHAPVAQSALACHDVLVFPLHRSVITQRLKDDAGKDVLFLFYGDQEISFDEPDLFAFGEQLARQPRFMAGAAVAWGEGYTWPRIRELLAQLLEAGILERAPADAADLRPTARAEGDRPNPLPPAETSNPRTWWDCAAITRELTGRAVELGHLELVIPIFRIAHMALDAEGRQVGEANVFPKALRLDVPTRWRTCIYPGSRFQDQRPMNVTALKSMRAHWPQMMACLLRFREAYLRRFPAARHGWTVGDVERFSTLVLAIPTYALMKPQAPVANGSLHPVLSSLFRVTDGLRMTTHQMLFVPVAEATLTPEAAITGKEIYDYAERNHAFASNHGVCAGPGAMIEEFLAVALDGAGAQRWSGVALDAAVEAALADMEAAFDYGLLGLQAHAAIFTLWPLMTRTYAQLDEIARSVPDPQAPPWATLSGHLQEKMEILQNHTLHATEAWRTNRERVYADMYAHCGAGLGDAVQVGLPERMAVSPQAMEGLVNLRLRTLLASYLGSKTPHEQWAVARLADCLTGFFLQASAGLQVAEEVQQKINRLLQRAPTANAFTFADIDVHVELQGSEARRLPHLLNILGSLLGFTVDITCHGIAVQALEKARLDLAQTDSLRCEKFADIGSADNRAESTLQEWSPL